MKHNAVEVLHGGRANEIVRKGEVVCRPAGPWAETVHALLRHVRAQGFDGVPEPFGFDEAGREVVSFIAGDVCNYPLSAAARSERALISAARLLRGYHDATVSFLADRGEACWMMSVRDSAEIICHGDFAPYNVVLDGDEAIAIIDFDTAHPAPRTWDIAYALYRWAPLTNPNNGDGFGTLAEQIARAKLFCDTYGLDQEKRQLLGGLVIERLEALVAYMFAEADAGNEAFCSNIEDGHHLLYQADIAYLRTHRQQIEKGLQNT